jgi:hypothetical protein
MLNLSKPPSAKLETPRSVTQDARQEEGVSVLVLAYACIGPAPEWQVLSSAICGRK